MQYDERLEQVRALKQQGLGRGKIAARLGITERKVRTLTSRLHVQATAQADSAAHTNAQSTQQAFLISKERYTYNPGTDTYVTFTKQGTFTLSGATHRALKQAYSDWDGVAATINEICRRFQMPRSYFVAYKEAHAWTHDSEPFSDEEIVSRDDDDLVNDAVQQRKQQIFQKFEQRKWEETKHAADKWWSFEQSVMLPLQEHMRQYLPRYSVPKINLPAAVSNGLALVLGIFEDWHFGKYGWESETGKPYSREIAVRRLQRSVEQLLVTILRFGRPERIIIPIGSDDLHVDNAQGTTTNGTPQDLDGTPAQISIEYVQHVVRFIDMIRQLSVPIEIVLVPGNHNRHVALWQALYLQAFYREAPDVTVHVEPSPHSYVVHGTTLLGFTHGDGVKAKDLGALMATEAAQDWGKSKHRAWFVGHLHFEKVTELGGVKIYQAPSLSGADRWHAQHGFTTATPGAAAYLIDKNDGVCATVFAPAE